MDSSPVEPSGSSPSSLYPPGGLSGGSCGALPASVSALMSSSCLHLVYGSCSIKGVFHDNEDRLSLHTWNLTTTTTTTPINSGHGPLSTPNGTSVVCADSACSASGSSSDEPQDRAKSTTTTCMSNPKSIHLEGHGSTITTYPRLHPKPSSTLVTPTTLPVQGRSRCSSTVSNVTDIDCAGNNGSSTADPKHHNLAGKKIVNDIVHMWLCCDGHDGHAAADFVSRHLPSNLCIPQFEPYNIRPPTSEITAASTSSASSCTTIAAALNTSINDATACSAPPVILSSPESPSNGGDSTAAKRKDEDQCGRLASDYCYPIFHYASSSTSTSGLASNYRNACYISYVNPVKDSISDYVDRWIQVYRNIDNKFRSRVTCISNMSGQLCSAGSCVLSVCIHQNILTCTGIGDSRAAIYELDLFRHSGPLLSEVPAYGCIDIRDHLEVPNRKFSHVNNKGDLKWPDDITGIMEDEKNTGGSDVGCDSGRFVDEPSVCFQVTPCTSTSSTGIEAASDGFSSSESSIDRPGRRSDGSSESSLKRECSYSPTTSSTVVIDTPSTTVTGVVDNKCDSMNEYDAIHPHVNVEEVIIDACRKSSSSVFNHSQPNPSTQTHYGGDSHFLRTHSSKPIVGRENTTAATSVPDSRVHAQGSLNEDHKHKDSSAALHFRFRYLIDEHRCMNPYEQSRIKALGGNISNNRISGILEPSRCIGDFDIKDKQPLNVVTNIPQIYMYKVHMPTIIVVGTDGLWDGIVTNADILLALRKYCKSFWKRLTQWYHHYVEKHRPQINAPPDDSAISFNSHLANDEREKIVGGGGPVGTHGESELVGRGSSPADTRKPSCYNGDRRLNKVISSSSDTSCSEDESSRSADVAPLPTSAEMSYLAKKISMKAKRQGTGDDCSLFIIYACPYSLLHPCG